MLVSSRLARARARSGPVVPNGEKTERERLGDLADGGGFCWHGVEPENSWRGNLQELDHEDRWAATGRRVRLTRASPPERNGAQPDQAFQCSGEGQARGRVAG